MTELLQSLHWLAGLVVLAEAANKVERTCPLAPGLDAHARLVEALKGIAWALLALGSAGAVATPALLALGFQPSQVVYFGLVAELLRLERPTLAETAVLLGFAVLIVRTRVKEG